MKCFLENYSNQTLRALTTKLKNKYFSKDDINENIIINISFGDLKDPINNIAEVTIDSTQINNLKNNKKAHCDIKFNNKIEFNRDVLTEAILHELIHLYQLTQDPDKYTINEHDTIFFDKLYEISKKSNIDIRINLSPQDVIPQNELDNTIKEITRDTHLIELTQPKNNTKQLAIVPDSILLKIYDYTKKKLKNNIITISDSPSKKELKTNTITNILGNRKCDIYDNYKNIDSLIKNDELELHFTKA